MRIVLLILIAFASSLTARITEFSFGMGYRSDRIKTEAGDFLIKEHALQSILESVKVETLAEHLLLGIALDYGILIKGKREQANVFLPGVQNLKDDYGYAADVFPKLGYYFICVDADSFKFYFEPNVGYGYSRVSLRSKEMAESGSAILFDTRSFLYEWYGPFLEAKFDFFNTCRWKCAFSYQYHFLRGKIRQPYFFIDSSIDLKTKMTSGYKHVGEIGLFYLPISFCTLGFEGYFMKGKSKRAKQQILGPATSSTSLEERKVTESYMNYSVLMSVLLWF